MVKSSVTVKPVRPRSHTHQHSSGELRSLRSLHAKHSLKLSIAVCVIYIGEAMRVRLAFQLNLYIVVT